MNRSFQKLLAVMLMTVLFIASIGLPSAKADSSVAAEPQWADGSYSVAMEVYHATDDKLSTGMNPYIAGPTTLYVQNGKKMVTFTINKSSIIPSLKAVNNGVTTEAVTISEDTVNDTRVVGIPVDNLTAALPGKVHISTLLPGGAPYEADQSFRFFFRTVSAPIKFTLLDAASDTASRMSSYVSTSIPKIWTYDIQKDQQLISFGWNSSSIITSFKVEQNGDLQETTTIATDAANNTRTVQFVTNSDQGLLNAKVKVDMDNPSYHMEHSVRVRLEGKIPGSVIELPETPPTAPEPVVTPEPVATPTPAPETGGTSLNFSINAEGSNELSVMDGFAVHPAKLAERDGKKYVSLTLKQSKEITSFKVENQEATVLSTNEAANTRIVEFAVPSENAKLSGSVSINWPEYGYDHSYNVDIVLKGIVAETPEENATPQPTATPQATTPPAGNPDPGNSGSSSLNFLIAVAGSNETSVMDSYVDHPAKLTTRDGKKYVSITLKQSKEITSFKVEGKETTVLSSDAAANKRVVEFEVPNESAKLSGWVSINWPEINYVHSYDVDIVLGEVSSGANPNAPSSGATPTPTPTPTASPSPTPAKTPDPAAPTGGNSGSNAPAAVTFTDINTSWAKADIERAVELGLVTGYTDGTFRPNAQVTRAEFVTILGRAIKLDQTVSTVSFKDAAKIQGWALPYVAQAAKAGILTGYADGTFRPDTQITRTEATVVLVRALGLSVDEKAKSSFADTKLIPAWAQGYVVTAVSEGLITGKNGNLFAPADNATRAEALTLVLRLLDHSIN